MQTRTRDTFTTIHTEGALLPVDLLQRILDGDKGLDGLSPESYHLSPGEKLNEAINRSWNRLQGAWSAFGSSRARLNPGDAGTGLTRDRWLLPLFQELGYGRLTGSKAVEIEGKSYPISHAWGAVPIHLVGCGLELEKRAAGVAGAARTSPHSLVQEYLNRSEEAQWGLLSNGLLLRVLRDNASLTRQAYLEFDLQAMFEGEAYSDFVLLWLVRHQSRFEDIHHGATEVTEKEKDTKVSVASRSGECWLEKWSKTAQERGTRALDDLRSGVEAAISALGSGFLRYPGNQALRQRLRSGELSAQDYYRQLLRLVYRLIFLFVAEDRGLLLDPQASPQATEIYTRYYSTARLRRLAERRRGTRHTDLFEGLGVMFSLLAGSPRPTSISMEEDKPLGLPVLGGFLFSPQALPDLAEARLDNQAVLEAVRSLAFLTEGSARRAVDYRNLGPEELGSIYESLLELHPLLHLDAGEFALTSAAGNERKTTGSYYTPSSLIRVLLDSALDPVIEDRVGAHRDAPSQQEQALLALKICDPACGSGHFLIAAAHRIAGKLAQVRAGGDEPPPNETRRALRDVIRHCIYGVDINPMAVELCKVNLWLESLEPGKPLSFLDAHIKCGNSLVGVGPKMELNDLEVPDEAFNPVTGDDKKAASVLKKLNKAEPAHQLGFQVTLLESQVDLQQYLVTLPQQLDDLPEDTAEEVEGKAEQYQNWLESGGYQHRKLIADLWTAAFFWPILSDNSPLQTPIQGNLIRMHRGLSISNGLAQIVSGMSEKLKFFHWGLAFPQVFSIEDSGFDCILGNPPWERIKLQEEEFFSSRDQEIATALNKSERQKLIDLLFQSNPLLARTFMESKHDGEALSKFIRQSERFLLTSMGDVNTYALFSELFNQLIGSTSRAGIIVPTGIATDNTTRTFFSALTSENKLVSLFAFINEQQIFPTVLHNFRFCLLTLSGKSTKIKTPDFIYECQTTEDLKKDLRHFTLSKEDLSLLNPNSLTAIPFWTNQDAELAKKIYKKIPILINEGFLDNYWSIKYLAMFHMANDSGLFSEDRRDGLLQLYEAKMFHQYNHRFGSFEINANKRSHILTSPSQEEYQKPNFSVVPYYWITETDVNSRLERRWDRKWFLAFRDVTSKSLERTAIFSILPKTGAGHTISIILPGQEIDTFSISCLLGNFNSLLCDYICRSKITGLHLSFGILNQLPILPPSAYQSFDKNYITPRILELVYTAYDLKPFAEDMGYQGEPFRWDEERRALLRAELDAYYARLYGLTRDELRYILDPQDVYGPDFPGETFRVLKEKEIKHFGEYRTRRLVLEAWDRLAEQGLEIGNPEGYHQPAAPHLPQQENIPMPPPKPESRPAPVQERRSTPAKDTVEPPAGQPSLTDFGVYKCESCGKMVMGFDLQAHQQVKHQGKDVKFKEVRK